MFETLGGILEALGELLEDLGDLLETLGDIFETLGDLLGAFGYLLETLGDLLETLGDLLGDSWRPTGYPWRLADPSWGPAGCPIVPLEASGWCQMVSREGKVMKTLVFSSIFKGSRWGQGGTRILREPCQVRVKRSLPGVGRK